MSAKTTAAITAATCLTLLTLTLGFIAGRTTAHSGPERGPLVQVFAAEDFSGASQWLDARRLTVAAPLPGASACDTDLPNGSAGYVSCDAFIAVGGHYAASA